MTREEAIKILSSCDGYGIPSGYNGGYAEAINIAIEALKVEPVKHGHWITKFWSADITTDNVSYLSAKCSACGKRMYFVTSIAHLPWAYCPKCGAKMDEEESHE